MPNWSLGIDRLSRGRRSFRESLNIITLSCFTCQSSKCAIIHHNEINGLSEHQNGKMASNPAMPALLINPYHPTAASL
jgi:hypothetical protein